jgi:hypothetical protein
MIVIKDPVHYVTVKSFAINQGILDKFDKAMTWIEEFGCRVATNEDGSAVHDMELTVCEVFKDDAPNSFFVKIHRRMKPQEYKQIGVMGCIYFENDKDWSFHS